MHIGKKHVLGITIMMILVLTGCSNENDRLAAMAERQLEHQAEQNRLLAAGTNRLIEADGASRQQLMNWQREMQAQNAVLHHQRDELEQERTALAAQRYWEPLLANAVGHCGMLLACVLPLVVCLYLLYPRVGDQHDLLVAEALIADLVAPEPLFYPVRGQFSRLETAVLVAERTP